MRKGLNLALIKIGRKLEADAKKDHNFKTRSGSLQRDIGYKIYSRKGATFKAITLKFGLGFDPTNATKTDWGGGVRYGVFVHEGTKPHEIKPKNGKALYFGGKFYKSVKHPGTKKDQFIYKAIKKNKLFMEKEISKSIKEVTRKF